jgi:hypothetical protein
MPDRKPANPRLLLALVVTFMLGISIVAIFVATR